MANPWFRLHAEFMSDPKVQMLSEADQRRFIMLLCLRCQSDKPEDFKDVTVTFALRITAENWAITQEALRDRYLIDENNMPTNWDKRQYINDIKDPTNADRQRRWRERNAKKRYSNVTHRLPDTDTDTDTENNAVVVTAQRKRAMRLQPTWTLPDDYRKAALEKGLSETEISNQADRMLNWSLSSKNGAKLDWYRTWLNWIADAPRLGSTGKPVQRDLRNVPDNLLSNEQYWAKRRQLKEA